MRKHPIAIYMAANSIETQAEAAKSLCLRDQQEVSDYVSWKHVPRPKKLQALAKRLGCSPAALLPDDENSDATSAEQQQLPLPVVERRTGDRRRRSQEPVTA